MSPRPAPDPWAFGLALALAAAALAAAPSAAHAARWSWSGSGVLDYTRLFRVRDQQALAKIGAVGEWSLKANVELSEKTSVTARLCTSCHGVMVDQAYAEVRVHRLLNAQAGRVTVPFGDYSMRYDPSTDALLSRPLPYEMGRMLRYQPERFNLGVLPMPYSDQGAVVFGDVWIRETLQIWYGLYGVNGFRSGVPRDFSFADQWSAAGWSDNNTDPSWGGRLAVARGPASIGASFLRGAYDPDARFDYQAWGLDGSIQHRGFQLRAEYLERGTDVLDGAQRELLAKKGFYGQLEAPLHPALKLVGRIDGLLRQGPPLGTDNDASSGIFRWTLGVGFAPTGDYSVRAQYEHWRFTDFTDADAVHVGLAVTY